MLKSVFRYVSGTPNFGLTFMNNNSQTDDVIGYADSDFAGAVAGRKIDRWLRDHAGRWVHISLGKTISRSRIIAMWIRVYGDVRSWKGGLVDAMVPRGERNS